MTYRTLMRQVEKNRGDLMGTLLVIALGLVWATGVWMDREKRPGQWDEEMDYWMNTGG